METILNFIDGKLTPGLSQRYLDNYEPATGQVYSRVVDSGKEDVDAAVNAASTALPAWIALTANERFTILQRIADLIHRDVDLLAHAESIDTGKPLSLARSMDIPRAAANMNFYATAGLHFSSESHTTGADAINYTLRNPVGVVGCISPWNLPLYLFTWKIAPALSAGCTVIAKPSELAPMTAFMFSKICIEAGLPPGVLNVVHGLGSAAGQAIIEHPDVKAISFTGGTATGKKIAATAGPHFKKTSLELGGKNPNIIFADSEFANAVSTSVRSSFTNQGEICLCGSRIFVERPIYERFVGEFSSQVNRLRVGDPLEMHTDVGALISRQHMEKVLGYIALAKSEGGEVLCGGAPVAVAGRCEQGYFVSPTVITGLTSACRTNQEEIFGPVVTVSAFDDEAEVIAEANSTPYGLSATIWTENVRRAHRVAASINSGIVWVNCWMLRDLRTPFGGMKQSGVGREGGWDALKFFTDAKNICIKL